MYTEASIDPGRCTTNANHNAMISSHIIHIDLFEDVNSPNSNPIRDEAKEEEAMEDQDTRGKSCRTRHTELPPNVSEIHAPTRDTSTYEAAEILKTTWVIPPTVVIHLRFGTLNPPTISHMVRNGTVAANITKVE
jgi:hypothetical protein